jgi:hypothetical protein
VDALWLIDGNVPCAVSMRHDERRTSFTNVCGRSEFRGGATIQMSAARATMYTDAVVLLLSVQTAI